MIKIVQDDITKMPVDCIVNAANQYLQAGSGVCGAIHKTAGSELEEECLSLPIIRTETKKFTYQGKTISSKEEIRCETGEAKITKAYDLPCKYVIHAVGPIYDKNKPIESEIFLISVYKNSFQLALDNKLKSIAIPAISTGIYGYPFEKATRIAFNVGSVYESLLNIYFVFCSDDDYNLAKQIFNKKV